ncbi:hypothetical protein M5K25_024649 [Dendrobium thyrsiflorum]|uniref:HAT C-terminal dimerisation domain-containing protein n=1 Tax=Dendrobium thyrsiflorum TaxID=117978 RepID=A0ABD0U2K3_DENTH
MVDGERASAMGFIYEAMNRAKKNIAKDLGGQESAYKEIWDIIDEKWDRQLNQHLHAVAYYLNPQFPYDKDFHVDKEVKNGLYAYMDRLISEEDYLKFNDQLENFHLKKGMFGFRAAQACYKTRSPERWWAQFGDEVLELKAFAVKVFSLTCSASACERNWSIFNQIHTKRINRLAVDRMNKLVYVMFNKKLKNRHLKLQKQGMSDNEIDHLLVDDLQSDDEWGTPKNVDVSKVEPERETHVNEDNEATPQVYKRKKQSEIGVSKKFKGDKGKSIIDEEEFEEDFNINYEDFSEDNQSDDEPTLGLDPKGMFYF